MYFFFNQRNCLYRILQSVLVTSWLHHTSLEKIWCRHYQIFYTPKKQKHNDNVQTYSEYSEEIASFYTHINKGNLKNDNENEKQGGSKISAIHIFTYKFR